VGNPEPNTVKQIVFGGIIRPRQRVAKRHFVRSTVTLENQTTQTQQGTSVVAPMIHTIL
jgi:hypothetical protein